MYHNAVLAAYFHGVPLGQAVSPFQIYSEAFLDSGAFATGFDFAEAYDRARQLYETKRVEMARRRLGPRSEAPKSVYVVLYKVFQDGSKAILAATGRPSAITPSSVPPAPWGTPETAPSVDPTILRTTPPVQPTPPAQPAQPAQPTPPKPSVRVGLSTGAKVALSAGFAIGFLALGTLILVGAARPSPVSRVEVRTNRRRRAATPRALAAAS